jgi:hypothetical protein
MSQATAALRAAAGGIRFHLTRLLLTEIFIDAQAAIAIEEETPRPPSPLGHGCLWNHLR